MGSQMSQMQSRLGTVASATVGQKSKSKANARRAPQPDVLAENDSPQGGSSVQTSEAHERNGYGGSERATENHWEASNASWIPEPKPVSLFLIYRRTACGRPVQYKLDSVQLRLYLNTYRS